MQIKFSKAADYTQCYLDIFDYSKADLKYINIDMPFFIYLSISFVDFNFILSIKQTFIFF